ncbi:tetratricopeptide repeat protein [Alisedimentitalea sp. MJ-SS2]|uniref:tetratricopeptide repeat protein n=1 Tax=Aliisedimentitalea sp. MJ-SS2 TaxID=3049795 RepID=UPI0029156DC6|nr:tetratricopeptide repeat protein [Alisedimentitalea sp. MJ-SS2]MDU8927242.1 tetratricopeptide repeat protein [Alisedimentitalea sp. MJ-SS2]
MRTVLLTLFLAGPVWAETCPEGPDHTVAMARLIEEIREAPNEASAREIMGHMWMLWSHAPDEVAQTILDAGMERRVAYDLLGAVKEFDRLVAYCPDYAEGWNQRAFAHFLRQDFAAALPDLDRALALSPTHLGALSGRALTLMALGREDEAQADLRVAVGLNPWLPERGMLKPDDPEL